MFLPLAAPAQQPSRAELAKIAQQPEGLREAARLAGHYVAIDLNPDDKPRSFISQEAKTYNNLSELAKDSTAIVIAIPLDQASRLSQNGTTILTEYRLRIEQDFKSHFKPGETVSLGIPGGKIEFPNGTSAEIVTPNFPRMLIGNRYVIFVGPREVSFRPTGGSQGIFEFLKDGRTVKPFKSGFEQNSLSILATENQTKFLQNVQSAAHD